MDVMHVVLQVWTTVHTDVVHTLAWHSCVNYIAVLGVQYIYHTLMPWGDTFRGGVL